MVDQVDGSRCEATILDQPRRRGRPRKLQSDPSAISSISSQAPRQRGAGRPRKLQPSATSPISSPQVPRRRGPAPPSHRLSKLRPLPDVRQVISVIARGVVTHRPRHSAWLHWSKGTPQDLISITICTLADQTKWRWG